MHRHSKPRQAVLGEPLFLDACHFFGTAPSAYETARFFILFVVTVYSICLLPYLVV